MNIDLPFATGRPVRREGTSWFLVHSPRPLDNFPLLRSRDVDEVRAFIKREYGHGALVPVRRGESFDAIINGCQLQNIGLRFGSFGASLRFEFPPLDHFCQLFPLRGAGETIRGPFTTELAPGGGALTSPDASHRTTLSADYEHLVLSIEAKALTRKLEALTGTTIVEPLRMDPRQDFRHPAARMLRRYVPLLVETLGTAELPIPDWWIAQTEQLIMTLLLSGHQHNYSNLLEQTVADAAPCQVKRAEDYIVENAHRAVSLEELADVTGVSAFSLFAAFRKHRGYSPREFVTRMRARHGAAR
jgi:AraC-binding-like domain